MTFLLFCLFRHKIVKSNENEEYHNMNRFKTLKSFACNIINLFQSAISIGIRSGTRERRHNVLKWMFFHFFEDLSISFDDFNILFQPNWSCFCHARGPTYAMRPWGLLRMFLVSTQNASSCNDCFFLFKSNTKRPTKWNNCPKYGMLEDQMKNVYMIYVGSFGFFIQSICNGSADALSTR